MSDWDVAQTAGSLPPSVAEEFDTQNGNAVPLAHILIINGFDSSENNVNGVITKGGVVGTGTSNEVDIVLTNRVHGNVQTVGATTGNALTFLTPNIAGIYNLFVQIAAFDSANSTGAIYDIEGIIIADGVGGLATLGTPVRDMDGDTTVFTAELVSVSFSGLNITVPVTGVAGHTIRWTAILTYVFGGA